MKFRHTLASLLLFPALSYADLVRVNDQNIEVKSNYSVYANQQRVTDRETVREALETKLVQDSIKKEEYMSNLFKFQSLLYEGQELTMKYTKEIEGALTLPAEILAYVAEGKTPDGALKEYAKEAFVSALTEIKESPDAYVKEVAYKYYSDAVRRYNENISIEESVKNNSPLSYDDAKRFLENSDYIGIYQQASQDLYHKAVNLKPLSQRWLDAIAGNIADDTIESFTLDIMSPSIIKPFSCLKGFRNTIYDKKAYFKEIAKKRELKLEELINASLLQEDTHSRQKIMPQMERGEIEGLFKRKNEALGQNNYIGYMETISMSSPQYMNSLTAIQKILF